MLTADGLAKRPGKSEGRVEKSLVERRMEDGNQKVGEMRGPLIHLKPPDHAMVGKEFGDSFDCGSSF